MQVKVITSGPLVTNTYVISKNDGCIIIDPSFAYDKIKEYVDNNKYRVLAILLTHGHFDHIECSTRLARDYNCKVYVSYYDLDMIFDATLNGSRKYIRKEIVLDKEYIKAFDEEFVLKFEDFYVDVIFTPGHSKGSVCYHIDEELFTGDTLFYAGFGRTDLYDGDSKQLDKSINILFNLDENINVFPGHGNKTSIKEEKQRYI